MLIGIHSPPVARRGWAARWAAAALVTACVSGAATASAQTITTIAGGVIANGVPGTSTGIANTRVLAVDGSNRVYFATLNVIYRLDPDGRLVVVAGTGTRGSSGDGGPAAAAQFDSSNVTALAADGSGNLYVAEWANIRKISPSGVITRVAGSNAHGYSGDGGPALSARFRNPQGLVADQVGGFYVADTASYRIRYVDAGGTVSTVVGNGATQNYEVEDTDALATGFSHGPAALALGPNGDLYFLDGGRVRRLSGGKVRTIAGTTLGLPRDVEGVVATQTQLGALNGLAVDAQGLVYVSDTSGRIRRVDASGRVWTIAGTGVVGYNVESGAARQVQLDNLRHIGLAADGSLYLADTGNRRVRVLDPAATTVSTVAGNGSWNYAGDGLAATATALSFPTEVIVSPSGTLVLSDYQNNRIREIRLDGTVATIAGSGAGVSAGDGGPASAAGIVGPSGLTFDQAGNLYVAEYGGHRVRRIGTDGLISTLLGTGAQGVPQEGAVGTETPVKWPMSIAVDAAGNVYVGAEYAVWRIDPASGRVYRYAGTMASGNPVSGVAATASPVFPWGLAMSIGGELLIADYQGRIAKVDSTGTILNLPNLGGSATEIHQASSGHIYYGAGDRVALITPAGSRTWFAGSYVGYGGDGGPATDARMDGVRGLTIRGGALFIADSANGRIRMVTLPNRAPLANAGADQVAECGSAVTLTGTGTDPDGNALTFTWAGSFGTASGPTVSLSLPRGMHTITLTVSDGMAASSDTVVVTVNDTTRPTLTLPTELLVREQRTASGTAVDVLTAAGVKGTDACGAPTLIAAPAGPYPVGDTAVTITARDAAGNTATGILVVRIVAASAPEPGRAVYAWGHNGSGQAGLDPAAGTNVWEPRPITGISGSLRKVTGGWQHTLLLKEDGTVWALGRNLEGQLGDGTFVSSIIPVQVLGLADIVDVVAMEQGGIALKADNTVWTWGSNHQLQLGPGAPTPQFGHQARAAQVPGLTDAAAIAYAGSVFVLRTDGTVVSWGDCRYGQMGTGVDCAADGNLRYGNPGPVTVSALSNVTAIAGRGWHVLALTADGRVWSWGDNRQGQVGDGTSVEKRLTPVAVFEGARKVAAGSTFSAAIKDDGSLYAWGLGLAVGDGTGVGKSIPTRALIDSVTDVAGAGSTAIALRSDGSAWVWGEGSFGKMGCLQDASGPCGSTSTPRPVPGLTAVALVGAGDEHMLAHTGRVDRTAPVLDLPSDMFVEATGSAGAVVTYAAAATDDQDASPALACSPASGSTFPLGRTVVECSATDAAGNVGRGSFAVTVRDTTAPTLDLPSDMFVEAAGPAGATVTFAASAADTVDASPSVACTPTSGSGFPLGRTVVDCSATDAAGNVGRGSFAVTVRDTTAPMLDLPGTLTVPAESALGASVTFAVSATDLVDGALTPTCARASGSVFAPGVTTVACAATDSAGNRAEGAFTVHVVYTFGGFRPPVLADGSAIFKMGRTVPVKFVLTAGGSVVSNATATFTVLRFTNQVLGTTEVITDAAGNSNTANLFRYEDGQYIYNWQTTNLPQGTYVLRTTVNDGAIYDVQVSLR